MVEKELLLAIEEVGECDGTVGPIGGVGFKELHHREVAELVFEGCSSASGSFFLGQKLFAGCEPFLLGDDLDHVNMGPFKGALPYLAL